MHARTALLASLLTLLLAHSATARAADPTLAAGHRLAANCASCHGTNGQAQGSALPRLVGQSKADLVLKMKEYKAGTRAATIMHQLAKGYTDEQIELIAAYFAAQKQ